MNPLIAAISGQAVLNAVIMLAIAGVVWYLINWLLNYIGVVDPFLKVAKVMLAIFVVLICINALLTLAGHPLVSWP